MKTFLSALLRHAMSTNNKKLYALIVALFLGIVVIIKKTHDHKHDKLKKCL